MQVESYPGKYTCTSLLLLKPRMASSGARRLGRNMDFCMVWAWKIASFERESTCCAAHGTWMVALGFLGHAERSLHFSFARDTICAE